MSDSLVEFAFSSSSVELAFETVLRASGGCEALVPSSGPLEDAAGESPPWFWRQESRFDWRSFTFASSARM